MSITFAQTTPDEIQKAIDVGSVSPWDLLWAALIVVGGVLLSRLVRWPLRRKLTSATDLPEGPVSLLTKLVAWLVITISVVFALPYLGVDVTPMFVVLLVAVAVIVVSGRAVVENYGAGVVLQAEGQFGPGDQIVTNDEMGKVLEVGSRVMTMETLDGRRLVMPNSLVLSNPLRVLTALEHRRSQLEVGLAYGTDLDHAKEVLRSAAQAATGVVNSPPVEVHVSEFADSAITFLVWFWHESDLQSGFDTTDNVARALDRACRESRLVIAFPQRTLWMESQPDKSPST